MMDDMSYPGPAIPTMDIADQVYHIPTGEHWVVALVEDNKLYWMGYPFGGYAALSDCTLERKATAAERDKVFQALLRSVSSARPCQAAREILERKANAIKG